jgi:hypothetical protein
MTSQDAGRKHDPSHLALAMLSDAAGKLPVASAPSLRGAQATGCATSARAGTTAAPVGCSATTGRLAGETCARVVLDYELKRDCQRFRQRGTRDRDEDGASERRAG